MMKRVLNKKGVTLTEMIVTIAVFSIMMVAVTAIFTPMMGTFRRANNLAEANTLLDNIATFMLADLNSAINQKPLDEYGEVLGITPGVYFDASTNELNIFSSRYFSVRYTNTTNGIRRGVGNTAPTYLLEGRFFRFIYFEPPYFSSDGVVYLTLRLEHERDNWEPLSRTYAIRPMGLQ